jgi:hypothetical protein
MIPSESTDNLRPLDCLQKWGVAGRRLYHHTGKSPPRLNATRHKSVRPGNIPGSRRSLGLERIRRYALGPEEEPPTLPNGEAPLPAIGRFGMMRSFYAVSVVLSLLSPR